MVPEARRRPFRQPRATVMTRTSTPCIRVCLLDPVTGLCEGCGRTGREIADWYRLAEEERQRIMAGLEARMRRAFADPDPDREATS